MTKIAAFIAVMVAMAGLTLFALQMLHRRTPYLPTRPTGVPVNATYIQGTNGKVAGTVFSCRK